MNAWRIIVALAVAELAMMACVETIQTHGLAFVAALPLIMIALAFAQWDGAVRKER